MVTPFSSVGADIVELLFAGALSTTTIPYGINPPISLARIFGAQLPTRQVFSLHTHHLTTTILITGMKTFHDGSVGRMCGGLITSGMWLLWLVA